MLNRPYGGIALWVSDKPMNALLENLADFE
jgi:hypothetical protein